LCAPLLIAICLWCLHRIHEPQDHGYTPPAFAPGSLKSIVRNRPFLILLTAYTIGAFGSNLPATLILYYVQYVLQSSRADLFLLIYFASGILLLPVWIRISKRIGKKNAWLASIAVNTCAFSGVYFLGVGDEWAYAVRVAVSGMGFGTTLALPSAIQADVIDYDEFLTDRRKEGWYIGIWSVIKKLAAAVGVGAGLTLLGMSGYAPGKEQSPEFVQSLKVLYALVPSACNAVAFAIALTFPISQSVHRPILENIALLKQGREATDPLKP
jgi:GPH family glycoside/pentoside/hexuronide:cation symporter